MFQTGISVDILFVSLPVKALPTSDTLDVLSEEHLCHLDEAGKHWRTITAQGVFHIYCIQKASSGQQGGVRAEYTQPFTMNARNTEFQWSAGSGNDYEARTQYSQLHDHLESYQDVGKAEGGLLECPRLPG